MGKGKIARYEQFLLFPQCFQKACFPGAPKGVIVWEWVKTITACEGSLNPFPNDRFFTSSKLKHSADNSFKFDENSRKIYKRVENSG